MAYLLKIYANPRAAQKGFRIFNFDPANWGKECKAEREMPAEYGASSMTMHERYDDAIEHARRNLPERLFKVCF